ncbi:MAG: hypothetical protein L3K23_08760 [Thermoplasmata archaeon]|nr:hypothetical protein [Thermoplasmata archaeon]
MVGPTPGGGATRPRNEGELVHRRPDSHRHQVFPRRLLLPGERVLYEGRPGLVASRGGRLIVLAFLFALTLVLGAAALASTSSGTAVAGGVPAILLSTGFFGLLFGGLLALVLISWRHNAFALTHRRVVLVRGFSGSQFRFAELSQIRQLSASTEAVGPIVFEIQPLPLGPGVAPGPTTTLRWDAVQGAPAVHAFLQSTFAIARAQDHALLSARHRRAAVQRGRVICAYCGNPVQLDAVVGEAPRCPRCTAPLSQVRSPVAALSPVAGKVDPGPLLRPIVHLGRNALEWYRATAVVLVLLAALFALEESIASGAIPGVSSSPVLGAVGVSIPLLVIVAYLLGGQQLRRWGTTVRTLSGAFAWGSGPWSAVLRRLRRRFAVSAVAFGLSILFLAAAVVTFPEALSQASSTQTVPPLFAVAFAVEFGGFLATITASQTLLVASFPEVVAGSGDRHIDRLLRRGKAASLAAVLAELPPAGVLLYNFVVTPFGVPSAAWFWAAVISPLALFLGLSYTVAGFDRWIARGDQLWSGTPAELQPLSLTGTPDAGGPAASVGALGVPGAAVGIGSRVQLLPRRPWALYAIIVVVVLSVNAVGVAWVAGDLPGLASPRPTYHHPPIVLAKSGAVWAIPGNYYQWEEFPVNRSATLTGTFNATRSLDPYVMDSLDFVRLQTFGQVYSDRFGIQNVSNWTFDVKLTFNDRWYIVLWNPNATLSVQVTWATDCVVVFSSS